MAECIRLDRDCSEICSLLVQTISRNSSNIDVLARSCVEICERCADECSKHDHDHCKKCAEACNECAKICRKLIA
ncbi:four-helix bundle copper-binding protein [Exiguobacterium sp. s181]